MQKIEAVIQPSKLDSVKAALIEIGITGMEHAGDQSVRHERIHHLGAYGGN